MTPADELVAQARADGLVLALTPAGTLKVAGRRAAAARWAATLGERRPEIIEALRAEAAAPPAPLEPLTPGEREAILGWLAAIGETNEAAIRRTVEACERDAEVRAYFLWRAEEREGFEERAAIAEFDGGLPRQEAERLALENPFVVDDAARTARQAARAAFGNPKPRE